MKIWVDAQLSPAIAAWMCTSLNVEAIAVRDIGLRDAEDEEIFFNARSSSATIMTKDSDFVDLVRRHGTPPQILWVTCGNTSNEYLKGILARVWGDVRALLTSGEPIVEVADSRL